MPRLHLLDAVDDGNYHAGPTSFGIFSAVPQMPPAKGMQDFIQWRMNQHEKMPLEAFDPKPPEVRPQEKVWGQWGAQATIGGREPNSKRLPACDDAEAMPEPPCASFPGGCESLLKDARRMEGAAKRAEQLMQNALAAIQASKVMLGHAQKMAGDLFRNSYTHDIGDLKDYRLGSPKPLHPMAIRNARKFNDKWWGHLGRVSVLGEEDPWKQSDIPGRLLWGPWNYGEAPWEPYHKPHEDRLMEADKHDMSTALLTRFKERMDLDKRAAEYLNLVEAQTLGPASFSNAALNTLVGASFLKRVDSNGDDSPRRSLSQKLQKCERASMEEFLNLK